MSRASRRAASYEPVQGAAPFFGTESSADIEKVRLEPPPEVVSKVGCATGGFSA